MHNHPFAAKLRLMGAGCIPVFIGPPYNSLPFPVDIDYRHASVFFNITNTSAWLPEPVRWGHIDAGGHARHPNDAVWWLPDIDVSDVAIPVRPAVLGMWQCS